MKTQLDMSLSLTHCISPRAERYKALWKDVITVHHAAYYQSGDQPPADYDSTVVIPFITASGSFLIALAGPDDWVEKAYQILELALREEGIGAKTNSGYGRMSFDEDLTPPPSKPKVHYQIEKRRLLEEASPEGRNRGIVDQLSKMENLLLLTQKWRQTALYPFFSRS